MDLIRILADLLFFAAYVSTPHTFPEPLDAQTERLYIQRLRTGDDVAREKLIAHNLRLVAHISKKYEKAGRDLDDVISIGAIGLIKAVNTYDPDKGVPLSSYASRCVENEIRMSIRAERRQVYEVSLHDTVGLDGDGNEVSLIDLIGTDANVVPDAVQNKLDTEQLAHAMRAALTERERTVIRLRFGLFGGYRMPQREIAKLMGISRSYVSRIEKKALAKLALHCGRNA